MHSPDSSSRQKRHQSGAHGLLAFVFLTLLLLGTASDAQAQRAAAEATPRDETSRFSVGAGVGYTIYGDRGLGPIFVGQGAGLSLATANSPYATGLVEVRLNPRVRLGVGLSGSYVHAGARKGSALGGMDTPSQDWGGGGASVSARYVVNPDSVVEVSPLFALGVHAGGTKGQLAGSVVNESGGYDSVVLSSQDMGVDARFGLVLEHRLLPQLWLRMESSFASASYNSVRATYRSKGSTTKDSFSQAGVAAGFSPALQLRMTF